MSIPFQTHYSSNTINKQILQPVQLIGWWWHYWNQHFNTNKSVNFLCICINIFSRLLDQVYVCLARFKVVLPLQNFLKYCNGDNSSAGGNENSFPRKIISRVGGLAFLQRYDVFYFDFFYGGVRSSSSSWLSWSSRSSSSTEYLSCLPFSSPSYFLREDHH